MEETNFLYYLLLLLPHLVYLILNHINSPRNLPPGPFPWPVIGNLLNLGNKPHISLANLATTHGPLISLRLGTQLLVVGSSPCAATEILRNHDQIFSARYVPRSVPSCPDRLHLTMGWLDCNDRWKYLRTLCRTELFSSKMIESQARIRDNKVVELVKFLSTKEGRLVKIADAVFVTVFNMLSNIFMSKDFISLQEEREDKAKGLRATMREFVQLLSAPNLANYYTILSGLDLQGQNKRAREIYDEISRNWEDIIKERRDTGVSREKDFLDGLIDSEFSDEQINYLFLELLFAGANTSTSTVEWALTELMKDPEAMRKVRFELETVTSEKVVKESELLHLPYMHSVIKETLRLHPAAPLLLPHRASETCKVLNYTIPKDTQVVVNAWAIGRDPKAWEDPLTFKPERFHDSCMDYFNLNNHAYIPFGAGRRICPGLPMAAKQVPLILAALMQNFDWCLSHDVNPTELDMEEKFGLSLQKENPLVLIPKLRKING